MTDVITSKMSDAYGLYLTGRAFLRDSQKEALQMCLDRETGFTLALNMGSGKTLISLCAILHSISCQEELGTEDSPNFRCALVVASKILLSGWESEIKKFFKSNLPYQVYHSDWGKITPQWKLKPETMILLTTPDMVAKFYTSSRIEIGYFERVHFSESLYHSVSEPRAPGCLMYGNTWNVLLVDEIQDYTNIATKRCRALACIHARDRFALSGTPLTEPIPNRLFGYTQILQCSPELSNTSVCTKRMKVPGWTAAVVNSTLINIQTRVFTPPPMDHIIVTVPFTPEEALLYASYKQLLFRVESLVNTYSTPMNDRRLLRSFRLSIITYIRQSLICPMIPYSSLFMNSYKVEMGEKPSDLLTDLAQEHMDNLKISDWLNDETNMGSSRIKELKKKVDCHPNESIVVFSCFLSCLKMCNHFLNDGTRPVYLLDGKLTPKQREKVLEMFKQKQGSILLTSFQLGSTGLNLQSASVVCILDLWWNSGKTDQAIARICRFGQKAKKLTAYYFLSNTALEKVLLEKQNAKKEICTNEQTELFSIPKLRFHDIIGCLTKENIEDEYSKVI